MDRTDFVYAVGLLVFPFMCGFVTSLSWPGRRTLRRVMSFVLLGVFAGLFIWFVSALLGLFGGMVLGLPAVSTGFYYSEGTT